MTYSSFYFICIIFISGCLSASGSEEEFRWSYNGETGPDYWGKHYDDCDGSRQSPVDIVATEVSLDELLGPISFDGYDTVFNSSTLSLNETNNGHSIQVTIQGDHDIYISGGGLVGEYLLDQFHFHWGSSNDRGSEHSINQKFYPLEMHLVHYSGDFSGTSEAATEENGLAVLGVLFKIGEENSNFATIIDRLDDLTHQGDHVLINSFPIRQLLPTDLDVYYRYQGSLTTPPCYESVVWTMFKESVEISQEQMFAFRNLLINRRSETDVYLQDNFRPTQALGDRTIYTGDVRAITTSASGVSTYSVALFAGCLLVVCCSVLMHV